MDESPWKPIKYEDTIRKAKMAVDDSGFRYQQHEKTSPSWPCKERRSVIKCPARMEVNNEHYRIHGLHNHSTEAYNVKNVVDNHIKLLKRKPMVLTKHVLNDITNEIAGSTVCSLNNISNVETLRRKIRKERSYALGLPMKPKSIHDFEVNQPKHLTETVDGNLFLRKSTYISENEYVQIYASDVGIQWLKTHRTWCSDGTFATACFPFVQVYFIGTFVGENEHFVPCVYALLSSKTKNTYFALLKEVKILTGEDIVMTNFIVDFETAMILAIKEVFPGTKINGCFYHFRAIIRKNIQGKGLQRLFNESLNFRKFVVLLSALAFVPIDDVKEVYEKEVLAYLNKKH